MKQPMTDTEHTPAGYAAGSVVAPELYGIGDSPWKWCY